MNLKIECIRICLGTDGTTMYWPLYEGMEDLGPSPLDAEDALHAITGGSVPFEIACQDPKDDSVHNYETLREKPNMEAHNALVDFVQEKAEAGRIEWNDDAPVFWGLLDEIKDRKTETTVALQKV